MAPRVPPALKPFHPIVRAWFRETLGAPSAPQRGGWPAIASGASTLILAPTGTGKTLTAFLWELNQLIVDGAREPLPNAVQILYVSPLKALNNDIQRNLERPLSERTLEVSLDVVVERLERRDVEEMNRVRERTLEAVGDERVELPEEGGEGLAGAGRREDERILPARDRRPPGLLGRARAA